MTILLIQTQDKDDRVVDVTSCDKLFSACATSTTNSSTSSTDDSSAVREGDFHLAEADADADAEDSMLMHSSDDSSLSYSITSSVASYFNYVDDVHTGRIVETLQDDCSVISMDYSCASITLPDADPTGQIVSPKIHSAKAICQDEPTTSSESLSPRSVQAASLIGKRDLGSLRHSYKDQQQTLQSTTTVTNQHERNIPCHLSSIGLGAYTLNIINILREGWLHKKGSGGDLLGRQDWKKRYAYLTLVSNSRHPETEFPVFLVYRNDATSTPSTIIPLDSAVVLTTGELIEMNSDTESHRENVTFEIVQAKASKLTGATEGKKNVARRSFAAPKEETNAWAEAINLALIQFEKRRRN